MATGLYSWSQTAASNAAADSTIAWAEGQLPSTVNDSARSMMAVLAKWRDDISGVSISNTVLTTTGSANAQSLSTNQSIGALTNGWTVTFLAGYSNTAACTLALDGLAAKAIQKVSGTDLSGGELVAGSCYTVTYHQPSDSFVLHGGAGSATEGLIKLTAGTITNAATSPHDLTSYQGYRAIEFMLVGFQPGATSAALYCRTSTDGGSSYDAGSSDYRYNYMEGYSATDAASINAVTGQINLGGCNNTATNALNVRLTLWNPSSAALYTQISWEACSMGISGEAIINIRGWGWRAAAQNVDAIQFLFSTGNIAAGSYAIYARA